MEKIFFFGLISVLFKLVLSWIDRKSTESLPPSKNGTMYLSMHKFYGVLGLLFLTIWLLFVSFIFFQTDETLVKLFGILGVTLFFLGLGSFCLLLFRNHRVNYNTESITITNIFGKRTQIKMSDIQLVSSSFFSGFQLIRTQTQTLKIYPHLMGSEKLFKEMNKHVEQNQKQHNL